MADPVLWGLVLLLGVLGWVLLRLYWKNLIVVRNEAEYRDIVEYQTMLVSALLQKHPELLPSLSRLRFFPDQSGFFIVLNYQGQLLSHGDYEGDLTPPLPFDWPVAEIVALAKAGGGYVKYNYKGFIYESFVHGLASSPFIVCSGLYTDLQHIRTRLDTWQRVDRTLIKHRSKPTKTASEAKEA